MSLSTRSLRLPYGRVTALREVALLLALAACSSSNDSPPGSEAATGGAPGVSCLAGQVACGLACVDPLTHLAHCGACDHACAPGQQCQAGICACPAPLQLCGGVCVNLQGDGQSCGACGNVCAGATVCSAGTCQTSCTVAGQTQCGTSCVDLQTDVANCGQCGVPCSGGACVAGTCTCPVGQALCGGVCTEVTANDAHCGGCNQACPGDTVCANGACISPATGGTGGMGTGGAATGGVAAGGAATGGVATGGAATGGAATGGVATGGVATGGVATGGVATGGVATGGTGGTTGVCTNVRPTGTGWDAATCDQWATQTNECANAWMIDNNYCNESCGRCSATGTGGAGTGGAGTGGTSTGGTSTGGAPPTGKFVGNITTGYSNAVDTNGRTFKTYWDQLTPENAGKWGSVQSSATSGFNWSALDALYDHTQRNGIIFKQHTFVWGAQQPTGTITEAMVKAWMQQFCTRYPQTRLIDVVNEPPPHTTPSYDNAIGGGTNGNWQWIVNAFEWADQYCPNAILILNDYNNIEWADQNQHFINIVNTVKAAGAPIDAVGAQAHGMSGGQVSAATMRTLLTKLHNDTGLPVYITEYDISTTDDAAQLSLYQQHIPFFLDTDWVHGITIWGWIYGSTWSQAPYSGLIRDGSPRPAMTWLMQQLDRPAP